MVDKPIEKCTLAAEDFDMCSWQIKPCSAIDFGKGLLLSAFRRPFDFEGIALYCIDDEIAFDRKGAYQLATALPDVPQGLEVPKRVQPASSRNSRCAATAGSSPAPISPLGIDQAPSSLFRQNGPPG
jgi:hypothetical protein